MRMKSLVVGASVALALSSAFADDITFERNQFSSARSRSDVKAETLRARAAGQLLKAGESYNGFQPPATSLASRPGVKEETRAARAAGELLAAGEGDFQFAAQPTFVATRTRPEVKAEVLAARAAGELMPAGEAEYSGYADQNASVARARQPATSVAQVLRGTFKKDEPKQ
jgi:Domain of unknown function (DUF4148)